MTAPALHTAGDTRRRGPRGADHPVDPAARRAVAVTYDVRPARGFHVLVMVAIGEYLLGAPEVDRDVIFAGTSLYVLASDMFIPR